MANSPSTKPGDSLLAAVRDAEVVAPDEHSITRFDPFVAIPVPARDAMVMLAESAICRRFTVHPCRTRPEVGASEWCATCVALERLGVPHG